tara:strand:+ start:3246 stop:3674 length:429 start_codon:yes stop_codon:yes gene_type:complete
MDPRMYKKMLEEERPMPSAGAGSGLGHISRPPPSANAIPDTPMQNEVPTFDNFNQMEGSGLSGMNPVVNPNYNPPPFTQGAVIPHVSGALGQSNGLGKTKGKKMLYGIGALALGVATFYGAKKFATRKMLDYDDDDMLPDLD